MRKFATDSFQKPNTQQNLQNAQWYILNTFSRHEKKVKIMIEQIIYNYSLQNCIFEIKVPTEQVVTTYSINKERISEKIKFPGYVFIKMNYNPEIGYLISNISSVMGFFSSKNGPIPMSKSEVRKMGIDDSVEPENFIIGNCVSIINGPLKGLNGVIKSLNDNAKSAEIAVNILNSLQNVTVGYSQIENNIS